MDRTTNTPDERLNELVTELAELTGENYVQAMCRALEERRDRLVLRRTRRRPAGGVVRVTLEAEIPEEMLHLLPDEGDQGKDRGADDSATLR
jgi:hypothetical protein